MPEEINRLVTDSISNYFFTTSEFANQNLIQAGVSDTNIFFVGNTMIDTLLQNQSNFKRPDLFDDFGLEMGKYFVLTLHRPSNVDDAVHLKNILLELVGSSMDCKIIFPIHPRTQKSINESNFHHERLLFVSPLGYLEFNYLVMHAKVVITDSGGITEETTVMGIPCITLRDSTERPETCTIGTNELIGTDPIAIKPALQKLFKGEWKKGDIPEKWDGKAGERIVSSLINLFNI
jgi:UDP-N-acetylglucosamine 2-epimerase (non-hydrolysing)